MFWNLVATVFAGLGAAGIAMGIRAVTAKKAPKWLIPVFAGLGMMGYQVYIEYTWFDHMQSRLPDQATVISTQEEQAFWRPWSFLVPQITSFTVLDKSSIVRDRPQSDVVRFHLYRFRHSYGGRVTDGQYLANCGSREMVPLDSEGTPDTEDMRRLAQGDPLLTAVCP